MTKTKSVYIIILLFITILLTSCSNAVIPDNESIDHINVNIYDVVYQNSGYTFTIEEEDNIDYFINLNKELESQDNKKEERTVIEVEYNLQNGSLETFTYYVEEDYYNSTLYSLFNINEIKTQIVKFFNLDKEDITKVLFQSHTKDYVMESTNKELILDIYNYLEDYYLSNDYYMKNNNKNSILASANFFGSSEKYLTFAYIYNNAAFIENLYQKYPYLRSLYIKSEDIESIKVEDSSKNITLYTQKDIFDKLLDANLDETNGNSYSIYVKLNSEDNFILYSKCKTLPTFFKNTASNK